MFQSVAVCAVLLLGGLPGETAFLTGDAAERAGRWPEALSAWQACASQDPALAAYAWIREAGCREKTGDKAGAEALLRTVIAESGEGPWRPMAQAALARLLKKNGLSEESVALLATVLETDPQPWWMEPWAWMAAELGLADPARAAAGYVYFRSLAENSPYVATRRDAARKLASSSNSEDRLAAALALVRSGTLGEAGKILVLSSPAITDSQGRFLAARDFSAWLSKPPAKDELDAVAKNNAGNPWFRVWLAYGLRTLGTAVQYDAAGVLTDVLVRHYPESNDAGEALWWLARGLVSENQTEAAMEVYRRLRRDCPQHYRADDAQYEIGLWLHGSGKNENAEKELLALGQTYPDSPFRSHAYYLCSRISSETKDDKAARLHLVQTVDAGIGDYYAHRALDRFCEMQGVTGPPEMNLRVDGTHTLVRPFPPFGHPRVSPSALPENIAGDVRMQRLAFFGMNGLDEGEWEALALCKAAAREASPGSWYEAVAEAGFAHTVWDHIRANGWGMKKGRPIPERLHVEYPLAYWPLVNAQAKESGLDPLLMLAIMRQESTFRAGVKSSAGAAGLMQIMPATAQWMAATDPNVSKDHAGHLGSPVNSLRLGANYLVRMLDRNDGNLVYALAAYNAGPGNCSKWRKMFPAADLDTFIESIPYSETRHYVKRVLGNYAAYHSLYFYSPHYPQTIP